MAKIEIPDKMYDKLLELSKELNVQDNKRTPNVYFQIQDIEIVPAWEGRSDLETLHSAEYDKEFQTDTDAKEIKEYCFNHYIKAENNSEEEAETYFDGWGDGVFNSYLVDELGFELLSYEEKKVYKGAFLTAKECERHLKYNSHHYSEKARSYGSSAWRNPEIELVREFLMQLTVKK